MGSKGEDLQKPWEKSLTSKLPVGWAMSALHDYARRCHGIEAPIPCISTAAVLKRYLHHEKLSGVPDCREDVFEILAMPIDTSPSMLNIFMPHFIMAALDARAHS